MHAAFLAQAFNAADTNGDGTISPAEALDSIDQDGNGVVSPQESFDDLDANGDGVISPSELEGLAASRTPPMSGQQLFDSLDVDGDGRLSIDDAYRAVDADGDGSVSPHEAWESGDAARARALQDETRKYVDLVWMYNAHADVCKTVLSERLEIDCGRSIPPVIRLSDDERSEVLRVARQLGVTRQP